MNNAGAPPTLVILDTCVWISLAEMPTLLPLLDVLKKALRSPNFVLHVPETVRREFDRNGPELEKRAGKAFKGHMSSARTLRDLLPQKAADIDHLIKSAESEVAKRGANVVECLREVTALVHGGKQCQADPADFQETANRCLDLRPPAEKRNRSAVGDCLLWLSVLRHLSKGEVWFCTSNFNDFSGTREDELHPTLDAEAKTCGHRLTYFHDPTVLMKRLDATAPRLPEYFRELPLNFNMENCPRCGGPLAGGAYLRSQYGGLTYHRFCGSCGTQIDTGEWFD